MGMDNSTLTDKLLGGEFKAGTFIKGTTVKTIRLPNGIYTGNVEFVYNKEWWSLMAMEN